VASSTNAKIVVPYEAAGLVGAAQVLVDALKDAGDDDGSERSNGRGDVTEGLPPPPGYKGN
jgi:hypothetical protein